MTNWKLIFCNLCLISVMSASFGLEVKMSQATVEVARGDDVTLTCNFKPKSPKNDLIVITWTGDADETSGEKVIFGNYYSYGKVDIGPDYQGKAVIETDLDAKTSKLTLKQVTLKESRRIRCFVQIPGDIEGKTADTTFLLVQVAPSQPLCKVVGTAEYGHNISLTCVSEEGSPTPTYKWERYNVKNVPQAFPLKTTEKDGVLSLVNVSMETSGYYICLSSNKVGSAKCNMTLSVMPSSMNLATIGIVAGCIAGVIVLIIVIICCYRKRKQKQKPKDYEMENPMVEYHDNPPLENTEDGNTDIMAITEEGTDKACIDDLKNHFDYRRGSRDDLDQGGRDDLRDPDDRRGSRDDLRDRYDERRGSRDELRDRYDERRGSRDELRDRYDERRGSRDELRDRYDERRGSRDDLRDRYDERRDRYDDQRDRYR
ncbi:cell surface A33 antigen [Sinocyclocheilus rhinocerous]|uniref:Cell surface A33 antigen-like n=1 Tax=Sinocyclocheilus rhinocerous TaxID=307959 RepID=A0A673L1N6_9TELE|nr:PREDICTED: cell surface A33 antigen-like [Sinocyclocheilus rhinocerous]